MKKLIYVFTLFAILTSCDSDNETDADTDPIIGTWQLTSALENGVSIVSECQKNNTIFFAANGAVTIESFYEDVTGCISDGTENTTWSNSGNSSYEIDSDEPVEVNFSENNTVFSITTIETFSGMTYTTVITYRKI